MWSRHDTGYDSVAGPVNQGMRLAFDRPRMVDAPMPEQTSAIVAAARAVLEAALAAGRQTTAGGKAIDEHQVHAERLAYSATEVAAAEALAEYARQRREAGATDETTDLMAAAFAAAGSLITRPEILTKALLNGGTPAQKTRWLPPIAAGELMVAISVTEPDTGSDVASVRCRAEREKDGWRISGAKAWCTFAGRADVIALLARTNPDVVAGARGLSLFIVPKDPFPGHEFEMRQPEGGVLHGKADATPGYRGMHSFTLGFDRYFVPAENLIGEQAGEGKGFYLQMQGFAAGRLQTGGRATGLAQAALEATATYAGERKQFGLPIGEFQLTQYKLGRMATHIAAARQLTYAAALAMDADEKVSLEPAMAKLFASDVAVWVTQEGQLLHGGWGYAEEFPISRHVADAVVLPIFEGVKPILELKVIARQLLGG